MAPSAQAVIALGAHEEASLRTERLPSRRAIRPQRLSWTAKYWEAHRWFLQPTSFDLQRAREKREMAKRLRQLAPGLSVLADKLWLLADAAILEAEAARLVGTAPPTPPTGS